MTDPVPGGPTGAVLADALVEDAGAHVLGVILYGSQLLGAAPNPHSAWDFVVVVDGYRPFYRGLVERGHHHRSPALLTAVARVLPPNVLAFMPDLPGDPVAKCMVISAQHLERALSPRAPDHFVKGRLVQKVAILHARDRTTREWLEGLLASARRNVPAWVRPRMQGPVTPEEFARLMLRVSYDGEVRPEAQDRVEEVFSAQRDELTAMYEEVLDEEVRRGGFERLADGRYRPASPPRLVDRLASRLYFARSKARAVSRWFKHVVTFADWLTYVQRKVERRTGQRVELTERERRWPLIFLWPKVFRVLRSLPEGNGETGSPEEGDALSDHRADSDATPGGVDEDEPAGARGDR